MQFYGKASENVMTPAAGQLCGWCMTANGVISILFASGLYTIKLLLFLHPPLSLSLSLWPTHLLRITCVLTLLAFAF